MSSTVTAQLILIQGEGFQSTIELENRNLSIGRAQNCDVIWGSLQISRKHATLEYNDRHWYIRDTSTNGLSVNGLKLVKGELHALKDADIISFIPTGTVRYRFRYTLTSPIRNVPSSRLQSNAISPQPSTSRSALTNSSTSIPRSSVITSVSRPQVVEILNSNSDSDDDSNQSESLLSLDPPDDYYSFSADENVQSPSVDAESDNASSGPSVSKRKHKGDFSSDDSNSNSAGDRKKKRIQYQSSSEDDDSSKSDSHISNCSSVIKRHRLQSSKNGLITDDLINKCDDVEALKKHLRECVTKLKSTEIRLQTVEFERTIEREELVRKEHNVRSVNAAFKEETYKKILELMESELSCAVCNEVFIQATVVDCGHTFCHFCINEWARKKMECPICRKAFRNRSRHIEMENFISKIFESFTEEIAARRAVSIKEREDQVKKSIEESTRAAENQARGGNGNNFQAFIQTTAERYVDFLAELHQINEILGPRGIGGRGGNAATSAAERRRSARIQDRVIDAVVAGAGGAGAHQGPARGRAHRGRGRAAAGVSNANNAPGAAAAPVQQLHSARQIPNINLNPIIPVVTLNDSDDRAPAPGLGFQNQIMNYVRRIPINISLIGDSNRNGNGGASN